MLNNLSNLGDRDTMGKFVPYKQKRRKEARKKQINNLVENRKDNKLINLDLLSKITNITDDIDSISLLISNMELSNQVFSKQTRLEELLTLDKNEFKIKNSNKLIGLSKAMENFNWVSGNYYTIDSINKRKITIAGTTCYTYYRTQTKFTDQDFTIVLKVQLTNMSDDHFYIGIINELVVPTSHCMCCTIQNGFYIQPNGDIIINAVRNQAALPFKHKITHVNVELKVSLSDKNLKTITFSADGKTSKPYLLNGNQFEVVAGSCNQKSGTIEIIDACYN